MVPLIYAVEHARLHTGLGSHERKRLVGCLARAEFIGFDAEVTHVCGLSIAMSISLPAVRYSLLVSQLVDHPYAYNRPWKRGYK